MRLTLIILSLLFIIFCGIQFFAFKSQQGIETYSYKVNKKFKTFEIRSYESTLFTSVQLTNNKYKETSSKGFGILAGYIFGKNDRNEKISMTSPVSMSLEDSVTMMFMVPNKLKKENLPQPNESRIKFTEEPAKTVAAINFGGWANDEKIELYKQKLIAALDAEGIAHTNKFYFFGYNAPYEVFNRKNEIVVELTDDIYNQGLIKV